MVIEGEWYDICVNCFVLMVGICMFEGLMLVDIFDMLLFVLVSFVVVVFVVEDVLSWMILCVGVGSFEVVYIMLIFGIYFGIGD